MKIFIDPEDLKPKENTIVSIEELRSELERKLLLAADEIRKSYNDNLDNQVNDMLKLECENPGCENQGNYKNPYNLCDVCAQAFDYQMRNEIL